MGGVSVWWKFEYKSNYWARRNAPAELHWYYKWHPYILKGADSFNLILICDISTVGNLSLMTIFLSPSFTWEGGLRVEAQALDIQTRLGAIMCQKVTNTSTHVVICQCTNGPTWRVLCSPASKLELHAFLILNADRQKRANELKQLYYWLTAHF